MILREKDLCESAYRSLAAQVLSLCRQHQVPCILHTFPPAARALGATALHLPLPLLRAMPKEERAAFSSLGTSCHSIAEALEAQALGATYLLAGHIFDTSCKPGLPGRGLDFLAQVCAAVPLPVYAIGGITAETLPGVRRAGARAPVSERLYDLSRPRILPAHIGKELFPCHFTDQLLLYAVTDRAWTGRQTCWNSWRPPLQGGVTLVQLRGRPWTQPPSWQRPWKSGLCAAGITSP